MPYIQPPYLNTNTAYSQGRPLTTSEKMTFSAHHFPIEWGLEKAVGSEQDCYRETTFIDSWKECFMRIYSTLTGMWGCTMLRHCAKMLTLWELIIVICWELGILCSSFPRGFRCWAYLLGSRDYLCLFSFIITDDRNKTHPPNFKSFALLYLNLSIKNCECQIHSQRW